MRRFGPTIRSLRLSQGIGLRSTAERAGISPTYLSRIETGKEPPPKPEVVKRLSTVLGGDADLLFRLAKTTDPDLAEYIHRVPNLPTFLRTTKSMGLNGEHFEALLQSLETPRTPARLELISWFTQHAPSLADLYRDAVSIVFEQQLSARVRLVSHAVREIRNRLPEVVSGIKGPPRLDYKTRVDRLMKIWKREGMPVEATDGFGGSESPPSPHTQIGRRLLLEIMALLRHHQDACEKPMDAAVRLFLAVAPENKDVEETLRPVVNQWLDITGWFQRRAHDSGRQDDAIDEDEFQRNFERFESVLMALVGRFYRTVDELDEILEEANT